MENREKLVIDIGGTYTRLGLFHKNKLKEVKVISTPSKPEDLENFLVEYLSQKQSIRRIAVGAPGFWDADCILRQSINLPSYIGYPIWQKVAEQTQTEIFLKSDVELATIGEAIYGFENKYSNFLYINMGTGFGAGLYKDGQIFSTNYSPTLRIAFLLNNKSAEENPIAEMIINLVCILAPQIVVFGGGQIAEKWDSKIVPALEQSKKYLDSVMPYGIEFGRSKLEYPALYGGLELLGD